MPTRFVFRVVAPIADLGLRAGDMIRVEPGAPHPIVVVRSGDPNTGRLLLEIEAGRLEPVTGCPPLDALAQSIGAAHPAPPHPPHDPRPRVLPFRRKARQ